MASVVTRNFYGATGAVKTPFVMTRAARKVPKVPVVRILDSFESEIGRMFG